MQVFAWLLYKEESRGCDAVFLKHLIIIFFSPKTNHSPGKSTFICEALLPPGLLIHYLTEGLFSLEFDHDSETSAAAFTRLIK